MPQRVLILCTHKSARSQMAEGWLPVLGGDRFDVHSAGIAATQLCPLQTSPSHPSNWWGLSLPRRR